MLMMFNREVVIGSRRFVIRINGNSVQSNGESHFFGYPLHAHLSSITGTTISSLVDSIKGHFVFVGFEQDRLVVANDVGGGFRLYICTLGNTTYFSNDHDYLIQMMSENGSLQCDANEYRYWCRHGYTTGGTTYIAGLKKVEPASLIEITASGMNTTYYFKDIANEPDAEKHTETCLSELDHTVREATAPNKEVILFFSGGVDSTLLALLLKESGRAFCPVFMKMQPFSRDDYESYVRAKANAAYLGLSLHEINIDPYSNDELMTSIARIMPFDRHIALLHFAALRQIKEYHGTDVVLLSGQGADSVLSFGPSGQTRGDFVARLLMYYPFGFTAKAATRAVRHVLGSHVRAPKTTLEYLVAFCDPLKYFVVLRNDDPDGYRQYVETIVTRFQRYWKCPESLLMYLKIFSFLQGSDNQVVYASARHIGIDQVILPYTSPAFIYHTIKHKDKEKEFFHPKYAVRQSIKALGAKFPRPPKTPRHLVFKPLEELIKQSDQYFYQEAYRLTRDIRMTEWSQNNVKSNNK